MQVFHYSELPGGLISLLQIKEDCYKVLFLNVGLSYGGFQFDHMIDCRSPLSESTLTIVLESKTNLLLIIHSIVLQRQQVSSIWVLVS